MGSTCHDFAVMIEWVLRFFQPIVYFCKMEIQRYFIQIRYKGTRYHGWQIQPNAITVQEVVEKALTTLLRESIAVTGAGRTDTGVHASFFMAHFDSSNRELDNNDFLYKLNGILPVDIAVHSILNVPDNAHARFDAVSRTYKYYISREKNPFREDTAYRYLRPLDVEKMNEAAQILFDYNDFSSFSKLHTQVKTHRCKILEAKWEKENTKLVFTIKADRFLRNMVRAIVGTLLEVGKGKMDDKDFRKIIEAKDRGKAGTSVPAYGLFLVDIAYPDDAVKK